MQTEELENCAIDGVVPLDDGPIVPNNELEGSSSDNIHVSVELLMEIFFPEKLKTVSN